MLQCFTKLAFSTKIALFWGRLAQRLERLSYTQEVTGPNPVLPTIFHAEVAEWQTRYVQGVVSEQDV